MPSRKDEDGPLESPIPFHAGSNGEFIPRPLTARDRQAHQRLLTIADERSRHLGISRRDFLRSASGTAAALLVINEVYGCGPKDNCPAGYAVDEVMVCEPDIACDALTGTELVIDVHTHHVDPDGAWRENSAWEVFLQGTTQAACGEADFLDCFGIDHYIREIFINSDTALTVLTAAPLLEDESSLNSRERAITREIVNAMADTERLLVHGFVTPHTQLEAQLDFMQQQAECLTLAGWKVYTPLGGWRLDDPAIGIPMIEKARELGITNIAAHKGLPLLGFDPASASPEDIGVVAAMFPDVNFLVYHSGYDSAWVEGPYDPLSPSGVDRLIKSMEDNGLGPNSNVYADVGTTWRALMTSPMQAAHLFGKLLRYVGEDRVLWGTDSIWYGSPQPQIDAFRLLDIPAQMQMDYGYPELTPAIRSKVLGLNAAQVYDIDVNALRCAISEDHLTQCKLAAVDRPTLRAPMLGPRTRREFFAFLRSRGGMPG